MLTTKMKAQQAVTRIVDDLEGRGDLGAEFESIDNKTKNEIVERWTAIITHEFDNTATVVERHPQPGE